MKKTLGGDRLGSGKKMKVDLHEFGWSTHNLSSVVRTDQACGTIVPYRCDILTNGDVANFRINSKVRTLPTVGPVFGVFKHQIDVFQIPFRLYIAVLHNNALKIGLDMKKAILPIIQLKAISINDTDPEVPSNGFSSSSLLAYLGLRGMPTLNESAQVKVTFPGQFLLAYWDIYKNYYANKQEERGFVVVPGKMQPQEGYVRSTGNVPVVTQVIKNGVWTADARNGIPAGTSIWFMDGNGNPIYFEEIKNKQINAEYPGPKLTYFSTFMAPKEGNQSEMIVTGFIKPKTGNAAAGYPEEIELQEFKLENIDKERERILGAPKGSPYQIGETGDYPYQASIRQDHLLTSAGDYAVDSVINQVGLGIKCYQSDRFNNWLNTEWIDGDNGINDITSIDVSSGVLKINTLILQKKMFNMLNRIAVTDGSYRAWQEAVYGEKAERIVESPIYEGGYSSEIVFSEVVGTAATQTNGNNTPLGSLAGRGTTVDEKGGVIKVKAKEPTMVMILGSITPRIGYSQGNKWWTRLKTMDDLHKPSLDGIGFQDLITDEMVFSDTTLNTDGSRTYKSAGKQVSWQEYMTETDANYGGFASGNELSFMVLDRNYQIDESNQRIKDLTTYIDPRRFNHIFADAKLSARNFWVQIAIECTARRKMSAKQIPTL